MEEEGDKFDEGKVKWSLLPFAELEDIARVFEYGSEKYGKDNWRKGFRYERLWDSIMRHLTSFKCGKDIDESGHAHLAHATAACLMLYHHSKYRTGRDDRQKDILLKNS